jgi:type IV secretion system protein VirD4
MAMGLRTRIACLGIGAVIGLSAATQIVAWRYQYQPALGWGLVIGKSAALGLPEPSGANSNKQSRSQKARAEKTRAAAQAQAPAKLYPPWNFLIWQKKWGQNPDHRPVLNMGFGVMVFGFASGALLTNLFDRPNLGDTQGNGRGSSRSSGHAVSGRRARGWGSLSALKKAGFWGHHPAGFGGVVFGRVTRPSLLDKLVAPKLLTSTDLRPILVTGGTRSGKGRGIVVPSLLNWTGSAVIFDPKGELWDITSGHRASFGQALFFNPRSPRTARFNPMAEIGTGPDAIAQVQRLVSVLCEQAGGSGTQDFWDRQASEILGALILHVLYAGEEGHKNLIAVKALSADLDQACAIMQATLHEKSAVGIAIPHPYIDQIATAFLANHEKGRKSVQMTVRSYLSWLVGADIEYALSASEFQLGDLMCADHPVNLYIQVSPSDLKPLQSLVRLFFHLTAATFTTHVGSDADGRPKTHALLMALDEFPLLGKISFFEDVVRLASGYGIKCLFIAQSLNDISRVYGSHNGFIDNAHIYVAFAALDPTTQDKVSRLTGHVTQTRSSSSQSHSLEGRGSTTLSQYERPLMEASEIGALEDGEQLIFVAGHRPYLLPKLHYDKVFWMAERAALPAPAHNFGASKALSHPWAGVAPLGFKPNETRQGSPATHGNGSFHNGQAPVANMNRDTSPRNKPSAKPAQPRQISFDFVTRDQAAALASSQAASASTLPANPTPGPASDHDNENHTDFLDDLERGAL